jgi:crotonobetainyl-CoA:carnitine CoA-transferase CaiB-like acyl-CoA transferase
MVRMRADPQALGVEVDLAATEALFRLLDPLPVEHEQLGQVRKPEGNRASYTAPSNMYRSRDGVYFSLVASSNAIFARVCEVVGRPEWATDPRFASNPARVRHLEVLDEGLGAWFEAQAYDAIATQLEAGGIPFSKVYTIEDIERDPHYQAREAIIRLPDPECGSLPAPCIVPRVPGRTLPIPRTGPGVGEHNAQVYADFGVDATELARLKQAGVV